MNKINSSVAGIKQLLVSLEQYLFVHLLTVHISAELFFFLCVCVCKYVGLLSFSMQLERRLLVASEIYHLLAISEGKECFFLLNNSNEFLRKTVIGSFAYFVRITKVTWIGNIIRRLRTHSHSWSWRGRGIGVLHSIKIESASKWKERGSFKS